jgi:hypothetical protein
MEIIAIGEQNRPIREQLGVQRCLKDKPLSLVAMTSRTISLSALYGYDISFMLNKDHK